MSIYCHGCQSLYDENQQLRSRLEWKEIGEEQKDGKVYLLYGPRLHDSGWLVTGYWSKSSEAWMAGAREVKPTHYLEIPPFPKEGE